MDNDFVFFQQRKSCNNLVLFVHGFTGDSHKTWTNKSEVSFPNLLLKNDYISDHFDVASYGYFSTLVDLFGINKEKFRRIKNFFRKKTHKNESNLEINELAKNLSGHLRITLSQYDNVYIIAHSMGGLLTKCLITDELKENGWTKVKLFLSLAVPHQGAEMAVIGGLFSNNLQLGNLNPVNKFINKLNQKWVDLDNKPTTKYFYGSYDVVVSQYSAVAIDKIEKDIISVAEDHVSISKPASVNSIVYNSACLFLTESHKHNHVGEVGYQKCIEEDSYDEYLFLIKLIIADIAKESQDNAKELFFNAEYMSKHFNSHHDKKQLQKLFDNIRQLYKDSYDKYLSDETMNSGKLLAEVHTKITSEDSGLLKSLISTLQPYHKKGMLHQLANDQNSDIWWASNEAIQFKGIDK
ncbi:ABC-three component system protein [Psychromonas sp. SA13A]|uniref:ABC-three component system protein n=1 Tax=Psychromonas sp. SA13A TaxID=2686346 RepID=UPI00140D1C89|nr:ABC-three component system protein [Psychromonas sp. SA13A]